MCLPSAPDAPAAPAQRQSAKLPDEGATAARTDMTAARRRALMATVLTSPQGALGNPSTTGSGTLGG